MKPVSALSTSRFAESIPKSARVWVFGLANNIRPEQREAIESGLARFVSEWKSHGTPVQGSWDILYDRFVLMLADGDQVHVSGCSTDSVFRAVREVVAEAGNAVLDASSVFYRVPQTGDIAAISRADFQKEVSRGVVGPQTIVFDTALQTFGEVREGKLELPFAQAWHAKAFELAE